ncbi:hydantoinase/carbamoylase family amidase [Corynebacterium sp. 3HC-13]|uniref:M20 family metallo-hydrolase n=1 Tax=Corynebacterium poyangense TaxID=2684405 RepID=UPI001CC9D374|nr:M20 family metallo-hydrolase [Corynebacterium poyangense]MBZ8177675.1 hydantoinase/carbamoylase family amidase [Corynebacterium poyangense]
MTSWQDTFFSDFAAMSQFGATPGGGIDRQAATDADAEVRRWFHQWLEAHHFQVEYDPIGNQFGLLEFYPGAPYVLCGSHLDSQPLAGKFDGSYGVLAAASAASLLGYQASMEALHPKYNLAVVNWFNEEGSRFSPSMMGSGVYCSKLSLDEAQASTDDRGTSVDAELTAHGFKGKFTFPTPISYAEIHVEQGRNLENLGKQIGLVTETWGARKFTVRVIGEQAHTGSTLIADRKDALFGAALVITEVRRLAERCQKELLQASVSHIEVLPNSPVTISRETTINVDLRSPSSEALDWAVLALEKILDNVEKEASVRVEKNLTHSWELSPYCAEGINLTQHIAEEMGISYAKVQTVAGHDSTNLKDLCPTVMLFVPSVEGISHNEREFTKPDDLLAGRDFLVEVLSTLVTDGLA